MQEILFENDTTHIYLKENEITFLGKFVHIILPENLSTIILTSLQTNSVRKIIIAAEYFDVRFSKFLFSFFQLIMSEGWDGIIEWHYEENDEDMHQAGIEYKILYQNKFFLKEFSEKS